MLQLYFKMQQHCSTQGTVWCILLVTESSPGFRIPCPAAPSQLLAILSFCWYSFVVWDHPLSDNRWQRWALKTNCWVWVNFFFINLWVFEPSEFPNLSMSVSAQWEGLYIEQGQGRRMAEDTGSWSTLNWGALQLTSSSPSLKSESGRLGRSKKGLGLCKWAAWEPSASDFPNLGKQGISYCCFLTFPWSNCTLYPDPLLADHSRWAHGVA